MCLGAGFGCVGEAINTTTCNTSVACPSNSLWKIFPLKVTDVVCSYLVDGTWTSWSNWSSCPATCGSATVYRMLFNQWKDHCKKRKIFIGTRNCTGASSGGVCLGSALDTQLCNTNVSCAREL